MLKKCYVHYIVHILQRSFQTNKYEYAFILKQHEFYHNRSCVGQLQPNHTDQHKYQGDFLNTQQL